MSTVTEKSLALLMPKGEIAWRGMQNGSQKELSDGIAVQAERDRVNGKNIVNDFYPNTTTLQKEWEEVFRLPSGEFLTQAQRAARLEASWARIAPGSFDGTNDIYALSGLGVKARPLRPGEDPRLIVSDKDGMIITDGRPGNISTNYITKFGASRFGQIQDSSRFGNFTGDKFDPLNITIPDDEWTWGMIYLIEGLDNGGPALLPVELMEAFYFLTYKIKPLFMWSIARVEFTDQPIIDEFQNLVYSNNEPIYTESSFIIENQLIAFSNGDTLGASNGDDLITIDRISTGEELFTKYLGT